MKKLKTQNGITLIALVITIIVMLILVAVTISMAINGGLFEKAWEAVGKTKNAMDEEQALANAISDYWGGKQTEEQKEHNWTRTGDTFTCSHCNATYEMGQVVNYTAEGKASTTISAAKSGLDRYYAKNNSYPSGENVDSKGNQTIEAQNSYWVVLGIEDTDGNGTNETLLITTQESVEGLYFYGVAGYNNAASYIGADGKKVEGEIDRICRELYSNSEYGEARGMTIEDVNSALNYEPIGGYYSEDGSTWKTTGNLTTKLKNIEEGTLFNSLKAKGTNTPDGTNTEAALGEYELNGYYYQVNNDGTALTNPVNDTTSPITEVEKNTIFGSSETFYYWLASRGVYACFDVANFGQGNVGDGGATSCNYFFVSNGNEYNHNAGLRPVVSLKSKLPIAAK